MNMCGDQTDMMLWFEKHDPEAMNFVRVCRECRHYDSCTCEERSGFKSIAGGCDEWIDAETGETWEARNRRKDS